MLLLPRSPVASRLSSLAALLLAAALATGCSTVGKVIKFDTTLAATVAAQANVNPDARKRPSPVVVRVYELKSSAVFEASDFVTLFEKDQAVLGAELVAREEMVLRPGESRALNKTLAPEVKFIGVVAGFRDLERARWQALVPVAGGKKNVLAITLDGIAVQVKRP